MSLYSHQTTNNLYLGKDSLIPEIDRMVQEWAEKHQGSVITATGRYGVKETHFQVYRVTKADAENYDEAEADYRRILERYHQKYSAL